MVPICTEWWCTEANEATQTHCYNPVAPAYHIWAYYAHGWQADAKRILLASPLADWRRQLGRPRITWLSTAQQDLKQHHLTLPEAADLAQNRSLWRMMSTYGAMQSWVACQKRRRRYQCCLGIDSYGEFCEISSELFSSFLMLIHNLQLSSCQDEFSTPPKFVIFVAQYIAKNFNAFHEFNKNWSLQQFLHDFCLFLKSVKSLHKLLFFHLNDLWKLSL